MSDIQFSQLEPDGTVTHLRSLPRAAVQRCRHLILVADHYHEDGTCKCNDPVERAKMIAEWGYTEADFE